MLTEVELKPMLTLSKAKSIANKKDSLTSKPTAFMQDPTGQDFVPTTSIVINGPYRGGTLRRKAAKRTEPWYIVPQHPRNLATPLFPPPPLPRNEIVPAKKKPRFEKTHPTTTAGRASSDFAVGLPPPADVSNEYDDDDANTDSVTDTELKQRATGANASWTPEEDAELTSAVENACKTKWGKKEYLIDWAAVAALVPGCTHTQCQNRRDNTLKLSIARTAKRAVMWTEDEDIVLKHSVQMHGGKSWFDIAALVPGRTKMQCMRRWNCCLKPNIDRATRRSGTWTEDEESTLRHAVKMQDGKDGKDWVAIAALVPGRTKKQCWSRWDRILDPNMDRATGSSGPWTAVEDSELVESFQMHGGKDWAAITALVPGRTKSQCTSRWHDFLKHSMVVAPVRTGRWTEDEDSKLKESVLKHGSKVWVLIATLVSTRTKKQCRNRWRNSLKPIIERTSGYSADWTKDEDTKLKCSVHTHGGKDWVAIAELLPGRTKKQCGSRWEDSLRSATEDENDKLKDWDAITALLPGLTKKTESEQMAKFLGSQHP